MEKIKLEDLYEGKKTVIKTKEFPSSKELVEPFVNKMKGLTNDFRIRAVMPNQLSITEGRDRVFNRVLIEAVLPGNQVEGHEEVISMLYGLDIQHPIVKFYKGLINKACTNLTVFEYDYLIVQSIAALDYKAVDELKDLTIGYDDKITKLKDSVIKTVDRKRILGEMVDKSLSSVINVGNIEYTINPSWLIKAYESMYHNQASPYFVANKETNFFTFFNAITQNLTNNKNVMGKYETTCMIYDLITPYLN